MCPEPRSGIGSASDPNPYASDPNPYDPNPYALDPLDLWAPRYLSLFVNSKYGTGYPVPYLPTYDLCAGGQCTCQQVRGPIQQASGAGRWLGHGAAAERGGGVSLLQGRGHLSGPTCLLPQASPNPGGGYLVSIFW